MILIKSLALIIPTIMILFVVVYLHIIMIVDTIKVLLALNNCRTDKETPCLAKIKSAFVKDFFLTKKKFHDRNLLVIGFGVFFFLHFALFINYYQTYINDDTKYHDAKAYYAVGMVPHTYSIGLVSVTTPLYPVLLGLNLPAIKIKDYFFNQGSKLIPDNDGGKRT